MKFIKIAVYAFLLQRIYDTTQKTLGAEEAMQKFVQLHIVALYAQPIVDSFDYKKSGMFGVGFMAGLTTYFAVNQSDG